MALWTLSRTTQVSRYQKKHSPTRTYCDHQSSIFCFLHPWHPPCSIYVPGSLFPQSLSKFSLVYLLAWHPQLHIPYTSSPSHCLLFAAHAHTIATCFAVVLRLCHLILVCLVCLSTLLGTLSCSLTPHINLTILISACWSATTFSFLTGQVSLSCNILLRTQLLYNLPLIINDISLLVSSGTNCLNLFHPIWIVVSTAASSSPSSLHSTCHLSNKTYPLTPDLHWHQYLHTNKCLYHFIHATLYTTTFHVYPLLTTSTLYWLITNALCFMSFHLFQCCSSFIDPVTVCWSFFNCGQYSMIPFIFFIHQLFYEPLMPFSSTITLPDTPFRQFDPVVFLLPSALLLKNFILLVGII